MITLNSEQGLISVNGWEDIEARPGFVPDLNPAENKLDSIIGRYLFKDKIKCGLSNCHTPHAKGYIVVTKSGLSTNIGKDCGKTYFGVDFETLSRKFDRDMVAHENRNMLCSFGFQVEEIENAILEIRKRSKGADWVHKKCSALLSVGQGCPAVVVRKLEAMTRTGSSTLSLPREATEEELDALEAAQGRKIPRPHIIEEPIAEIAGIQALYPENDLRELLILDLTKMLEDFKELDIDSLDYGALRKWAKWVGTVETKLEKVRAALAYGESLLSPKNLEPFLQVIPRGEESSSFRDYLRGLQDP